MRSLAERLPLTGLPRKESDAEQDSLRRDETVSAVDQTASDADQASADADQTASDRDQLDSETDERSARRDQEAADRDLPSEPSDATQKTYSATRRARKQSSLERQATALTRSKVAADRDRQATRRDAEAQGRDATAGASDLAADARDRALLEATEERGDGRREAAEVAAELRSHATADRARAAADRKLAASDRAEAARDRQELIAALEAAHIDDLTGAYRRGMGEVLLRNELERAQRTMSPLTLAVIDADDLKAFNDAGGHAAGDALLRDIATALRAKLRAYDPLVRTGGDEFVCTIAGSDLDTSRRRLADVSKALALIQPQASISVGLVEMQPGDTLVTLMERGDSALYEDKRRG